MTEPLFWPDGRSRLVTASAVYIAAVFGFSILADEHPWPVFFGTVPLLAYGGLVVAMRMPGAVLLWLGPIGISALFLGAWATQALPQFGGLDGPTLAVVNILLAYLLNVFLLAHGRRAKPHAMGVGGSHGSPAPAAGASAATSAAQQDEIKALKQTITDLQKTLTITEKNFRATLRTIEDKCKAINFVIGRVYGNRRGGAPSLRAKLRIPRDLYNAFSTMTADFKADDAKALLAVLDQLAAHLARLEQPERALLEAEDFRAGSAPREPSDRRILDVLAQDEDPVADYHAEAKEICLKLSEYLKTRAGLRGSRE